MYSQSNSFLGGGNSARPQPGQQQPSGYGGSSLLNSQQQASGGYGQPQQQALSQQYTGYPGQQPQAQYAQPTGMVGGGYGQQQAPQQQQPLSAQYTGYPGQQPQLNAMQTGYGGQQAQAQAQAPPPMPPSQPSFQYSQQTGLPPAQQQQSSQPPAAQALKPQMTSAQMAASFRGESAQQAPTPTGPVASGRKIPGIRLSFITAQDQAKFEQLFKSAVGDNSALSGEQARDILTRSKLTGNDLSSIWILADTTKSGHLMFPEFALAMYLCNLRMNGKSLPSSLPEQIKNEVSGMVDIISFAAADTSSRVASPPVIQQPQPQPNNIQLLSTLTSQPTGALNQMAGFGQGGLQSQQTGFPGQQGMQPQVTGFMGNQGQPGGYNGPRPPMPPMPTGFQNQGLGAGLQAQSTGLVSQPTGIPGQWGFVNAPAGGLQNLDAFKQQLMPQPGREGGFSMQGLQGNAKVPWAITKDEKKLYDDVFKSWDGFGRGFIAGPEAIEIFSQSGLAKSDLERIWTLSDPNNRGKLNTDEFAVAMHLVYRKLNGYPVPGRLPAELIPPSTRNLGDAMSSVKGLLARDSEQRKQSGAFLQPQRTGVSYMKSHSFRQGSPAQAGQRGDATVFRNNDDDVGYKSSARHRLGAGGRTPSPAPSDSSAPPHDDMSMDQLRKLISEKEVLLDAIDFRDEEGAEEDDVLDRRDKRDADDLYRRVRRVQEEIDSHPSSGSLAGSSDAERKIFRRQLQGFNDRLPDIASQVRRCERAIADAQLELFRIKDAKAHPSSGAPVVGTGPGGAVTESDRLRARAKAMMEARSAALRGKPVPASGNDDAEGAARRLESETSRVKQERENHERMVKDVEESVRDFGKSLEDRLKDGASSSASDHEKRRWEEGLGVEDAVREFIFEMQRETRLAQDRKKESGSRGTERSSARAEPTRSTSARFEEPARESAASPKPAAAPATNGSGSYSTYKTAEERAAYIKQQAEQRMAERLAALGIKAPSKPGETTAQRQERERKEADDRRRKAEEEDARKDAERQKRLEGESIAPPGKAAAKKPPPPPTRKGGASTAVDNDKRPSEIGQKRASLEVKESALREQQAAQEEETRRIQETARTQEDEADREREAQESRIRALEDQVRQGKLRKEEEKKKKQAAAREAKELEARRQSQSAARQAELDAARERERELQRQLETLGDDSSSDDEGLEQLTPNASQELRRDTPPKASPSPTPAVHVSSPPRAPSLPTAAPPAEPVANNNPFLKKMQATSSSDSAAASTPPQITPAASETSQSTNPFHRMLQNAPEAPSAATRAARARQNSDDWSVLDDDVEESSDDEGPVAGGGAKQLASLLFGTMAPPRPLSAMDNARNSSPATPKVTSPVYGSSSPPRAPPMPGSFAPPTSGSSAPPPPPMPGAGAPPPPPMPSAPKLGGGGAGRGALLGDIQAGARLRKTETKDRSSSSVAGRVLG